MSGVFGSSMQTTMPIRSPLHVFLRVLLLMAFPVEPCHDGLGSLRGPTEHMLIDELGDLPHLVRHLRTQVISYAEQFYEPVRDHREGRPFPDGPAFLLP